MHKIPIALGAAASLLAFGASAGVAQASSTARGHHGGGAEYVSPSGTSGGTDTSCATAACSTIGAAVAAAHSGGTVAVCPGTYAEQVVVSKPLNLYGMHAAVVTRRGCRRSAQGPPDCPAVSASASSAPTTPG